MTDTTVLEASARAKAGKGAARATRRAGLVPAVVYGAKREPALIALEPRALAREMGRTGWRARIYEIRVGGGRERALIRDVQLHPVNDRPLHVDFHRIAAGERVRVELTIAFHGEDASPGIKAGGVLNADHRSLEVSADPDRIPEHLVADISALAVGDAVHWHDLQGIDGLELVGHEEDPVIATIAAPTIEVEPEPEATADASAEGEAAAPAGDSGED